MKARRTSAGKSNRRKVDVNIPIEELGPNGRVAHYSAVLLENVNSKMDQVIEGVEGLRVSVDQKIDGLRNEMNGRFEIVEAAIRVNSRDIKDIKSDVSTLKTDVSTLKTDVKDIRSEMHGMETRLSAKIDRITDRVDNHEERISGLEVGRSV